MSVPLGGEVALVEGGFEGEIEFKDESDWGRVSLIGVHWLRPTESDLDDALYSAGRDGFDRIIIYI